MSKKIIYSSKEYEEEYPLLFDKYYLEYKEVEEIDFINNEIKNYSICLQIVNLPIDQAFDRWFRIETGTDLKTFSISEKTFNIIFEDENKKHYHKIYNDFRESSDGMEKKVKQSRLSFAKIISFLETKKSEIVTNSQIIMEAENTLNWNGNQTEFIELIKALIENGNIKGTQTEIISKLSTVFNIDIKNQNKLINDLKLRSNGSETLFLDKLKKSLYNYITLEKKK